MILGKKAYLKNKMFLLFLLSQGASGLGDVFKFIAITSLIFNITGSGLSAGVGLFFSIVPNILFSMLAGSIGDLLPPKLLLVPIELLRSVLGLLLINNRNLSYIYLLIILLSLLDTFNNPPLRKTLVNLLDEKNILTGNSYLSGTNAITSIIGSSVAGVLIAKYGVNIVLLVNCYLHSIAATFQIFLNLDNQKATNVRRKHTKSRIMTNKLIPSKHDRFSQTFFYKKANILEGCHYILQTSFLKKTVILTAITGFGIISVNMAFYPYAFNMLKVTEKGWGFMMSIFYGSSLIAMWISLWLNKKISKLKSPNMLNTILDIISYSLICLISLAWFIYSRTSNITVVLMIQLLEGILISLLGILLISKLQSNTNKRFLGRVTGINDFISSIFKIMGIFLAYIITSGYSPRYVFILSALCFLAFALPNLIATLLPSAKPLDHNL